MANIIREVWNFNVLEEFEMIKKFIPFSTHASFDLEFPGTIVHPNVPKPILTSLHPISNYAYMKANVDQLELIQVGLTLSYVSDHLFNVVNSLIWQFNLNDFDVDSDLQNPSSIALLRQHGIDFGRNKSDGIDSGLFGYLLMSSGLLCRDFPLNWVTFHGIYDFGFLVKIVTQKPLPPDLSMFVGMVKVIFGDYVFDLKYIVKFCNGLYGGLSRLAEILNVDRISGEIHQAGSDSLLTMQVFFKLKAIYFNGQPDYHLNRFKGIIHGLELTIQPPPPFLLTVPVWSQHVPTGGFIYNGLFLVRGENI